MSLKVTVLTDGSSDRVLLPLVRWVVGHQTTRPVQVDWAELRTLPRPPRELKARVEAALSLYPCDLLIVHRDAESQDPSLRFAEMGEAVAGLCPHVPVVPVRMQESWLLHDELAIRTAANRPSGREPLSLPALRRVEGIADPKRVLPEALVAAHGAKRRRARNFRPDQAAHRLAELIDDWAPLRALAAFVRFEADTAEALASLGVAKSANAALCVEALADD